MEDKLYILLDESGKVIGQNYFAEGKQPELSTDILPKQNYIVAYFNKDTKEYYEGASVEDLAEYQKTLVPYEVPLWSMRNVLRKKQMFDDILTAINLLPEPIKTDALDYLEYGNYIERNSNTVLLIQQIKGLNETEVDDLFIEANNLKL